MLNEVRKFQLLFMNSYSVFTYSLFDFYPTSPVAVKSAEGSEPKLGSVTYSLLHLMVGTLSWCNSLELTASCDAADFHFLHFTDYR